MNEKVELDLKFQLEALKIPGVRNFHLRHHVFCTDFCGFVGLFLFSRLVHMYIVDYVCRIKFNRAHFPVPFFALCGQNGGRETVENDARNSFAGIFSV